MNRGRFWSRHRAPRVPAPRVPLLPAIEPDPADVLRALTGLARLPEEEREAAVRRVVANYAARRVIYAHSPIELERIDREYAAVQAAYRQLSKPQQQTRGVAA